MPNNPIVVFFKYDHLPKHLRTVSRWFATIAALVDQLPPGPETSVSLRKLLEAKDAAVRASLACPDVLAAREHEDPVLLLDEVLDYLAPDQCGPLLADDDPESGIHDIRNILHRVRAWCLIAAHSPTNHDRSAP